MSPDLLAPREGPLLQKCKQLVNISAAVQARCAAYPKCNPEPPNVGQCCHFKASRVRSAMQSGADGGGLGLTSPLPEIDPWQY